MVTATMLYLANRPEFINSLSKDELQELIASAKDCVLNECICCMFFGWKDMGEDSFHGQCALLPEKEIPYGMAIKKRPEFCILKEVNHEEDVLQPSGEGQRETEEVGSSVSNVVPECFEQCGRGTDDPEKPA